MADNSIKQEIEAENMVGIQVFQRLMIIGVLDVIFACSLLICGVVGAIYGDDEYSGPPYFTGSFVTGVFIFCIPIIIMFGFMICFAGIVLLSISGVYSRCNDHDEKACSSIIGKYRSVAIPIIILVIHCAILNIYSGYYLCTKHHKLEKCRMVRIATLQVSNNNQMLMMYKEMSMQQLADQAQTGHLAGKNYSGVHMETNSKAGPAYPMEHSPSSYPMDLAAGYIMGLTTDYPMEPTTGYTISPTTGYPMGKGIPPPKQQFPVSYPQPSVSYSSPTTGPSSGVKINLNSSLEEPSAPPPSYESVTHQ